MKRTFILLTAVLALSVSCEKSYIPESGNGICRMQLEG